MTLSDFLLYAKRRLLPLLCVFVFCVICGSVVLADPISFAAGLAGAGIFPVMPADMSASNYTYPLNINLDWATAGLKINLYKNVFVDEQGTWHQVTISGDYVDSIKDAIDSFVGSYGIQANMDKTLYQTGARWGNIYFTEKLDDDHDVFILPVSYPGQVGSINDVNWTTETVGNDVRYYFQTPISSSRSGTFSPNLLNEYRIVLYLYNKVTDRRNVAIGNFAGSSVVWNQNYSDIIAQIGTDNAGVSVSNIEDISESEQLSFYVLEDDLPDSGEYTGEDALNVLEQVGDIPFDHTKDHAWEGVTPVPPTPVPTTDPNTIGGAPVEDLWNQTGEIIENQLEHKSIVERGINTISNGISQLLNWIGRVLGVLDDTNNDINIGFDDVSQGLNDIKIYQDDIQGNVDLIPPLVDDVESGLNDININVQEGTQTLNDIKIVDDDILVSVEGSKGILGDIKDAFGDVKDWVKDQTDSLTNTLDGIKDLVQDSVKDIVDSIDGVLEDIITAVEEGPINIFKTGLDGIKQVFGDLLSRLSGILGIWHYVVEWFNSISTPFTFFFGSAQSVSYYLILPVYACIAGGIVIAVYKRFGR